MSEAYGGDDTENDRRFKGPYSAKNPIPTIGKFREQKAARQDQALKGPSHTAVDDAHQQTGQPAQSKHDVSEQETGNQQEDEAPKDTSEIQPGASDPKQRRKELKGQKERAEREVTDPITHLPITIHDFTDQALKDAKIDEMSPGKGQEAATGPDGKRKDDQQLRQEQEKLQKGHYAMKSRFPPPDFDALRQELAAITRKGVTFGLFGSTAIAVGAVVLIQPLERLLRSQAEQTGGAIGTMASMMTLAASAGAVVVLVFGVRDWIARKISNVFEDETWDAQRQRMEEEAENHETETTIWLNSLMGAVWPLINPDLFASLGDTLEDVMQASLPKFVRMVSVDDIGQGSEALRILGVRWLPTGAAAQSVTQDGKLTKEEHFDEGRSSGEDDDEQEKSTPQNGNDVAKGMEAEEGEFINLEVAFAYRTRTSSTTMKQMTKDMHLYVAFYLPGNIKVPVWVDLQGIVGTMRMRLQLTPDPPFFSLCTLTFLGQPKVQLSCVPLSKHALNIMDVPFISNFVQSSVDAAMAEYVAPKSLSLDLKEMLAGEDYKKDTNARGVLMVHIKKGYDFKMGDTAVPLVKDGSSDPYVSVGWAKFGKVLWSTRIMISEMEPRWEETCFLLVTPEELNVDERLRVQLWDSDRMSADDDLGRIEVDLKEIMRNENARGRMWTRADNFRALKAGDNMPGKLEWSVGYFTKAPIQRDQFEQQTHDTDVRSMDQLKSKVHETCQKKMREALFKDGRTHRNEDEFEQQKAQELKEAQDAMIISAPPPEGYPSGLFSLQIHNITGLELEKTSKKEGRDDEASDEEEAGDGLPSAYCTIIINHRKTFKTRTKPQNSKPFYNAGCERFIPDWTDCEVFISVRDSRPDEDDPLLGIVYLPLNEIFKERSQVMGFWPIAGGIGHGRIRLSMVWRSVQLQAPRNLLGWQYGTLEVQPGVTSTDCPSDIQSCKLKVRTNISSKKLYADKESQSWNPKKRDDGLKLAVCKRYSSCMSIAFKQKGALGDSVVAFCVLWLRDIPDEEEQELELAIWKGDYKRATSNYLEECGEKLGSLKVKLKFWSGLGGAHSAWASKDKNTSDVVEVIDTARDALESDKMEKKVGIVDQEVDSSSEEDSSDDDVPDGSKGHKQGPIDQLRDYKKKDKGLHRRHRGIMQWKVRLGVNWP